ncbi:class I SAM-dependent methyltransferase [Aquibacillus koreensis]|uniref:Class I SAM-dependent methyltransferase n=1 Tax=Aquibacillus koreensis TaxID=279446 RepID=A0A9X3WHU9_9BACI|nr:class I SAM-dependent methyltransferase [Aquibacillus koreensis]MCT2535766.1 class I SAM-dependent methyltransferase [Aquibacillus koreensis]MDC3420222.1 class I SAM-dependent methyltransferase [Aquibacillus koreensis]
MIITTAGRTSNELIAKAKELSMKYELPYKERNGVSVESLQQKHQDDVIVVGKDRIYIAPLHDNAKLFFHPNLAMVRAKRMFKGEEESLVKAAKLTSGMSFLDCTLGLASDSIIASIAVGDSGSVTGIEGNSLLFFLANEGLSSFTTGNSDFDQAMRRIHVVYGDHLSFLQQAKTGSVDVIYFDPMFHETIDTSHGINSIRGQAVMAPLTAKVIDEAKRVARQRIILKDHWQSERFTQLGFIQHKRKTSLFHYGTMELTKE